jgi:hypothetical protein
VFGDRWFQGARCTTGVPLDVGCSLHRAALRGLPLTAHWQACVESVGKLSSLKGLQLLDGGVRHTGELAELPLREAPLAAMLSETEQRRSATLGGVSFAGLACGSLHKLHTPRLESVLC